MSVGLEDGIFYHLTVSTVAVKAIIGDRCYPQILPPKVTLPAITLTRISGAREVIMAKQSGLAHPRIQINCWAATYAEAKALAEEVRVSTDSFIGNMGTDVIKAVILQDEDDVLEIAPQSEANRRYGIRQDYEIWHEEPIT